MKKSRENRIPTILNVLFVIIALVIGYIVFSILTTENISLNKSIEILVTPLLTFFSAFVLYLTLNEQIKNNKKQTDDNKATQDWLMIQSLHEQLKGLINQITFKTETETVFGFPALYLIGYKEDDLFDGKDLHTLADISLIINQLLIVNYYSNARFETKIAIYHNILIYKRRLLEPINRVVVLSDSFIHKNDYEHIYKSRDKILSDLIKEIEEAYNANKIIS